MNEKIKIGNKNIIIYNIYYIEINVLKIIIHSKNSKIELIGRFKDYVDVLKKYDFFKLYRSILINMSKIEFYIDLSIKLKDFDELISISRNIKSEFVQEYKKYKVNIYMILNVFLKISIVLNLLIIIYLFTFEKLNKIQKYTFSLTFIILFITKEE